jgi:starch-binding outer membrane protein, SusD/RagB family
MRAKFTALGALLLTGAVACTDLTVPNQNQPDQERVLAEPGDVEALVAGGFQSWFLSNTWQRHSTFAVVAFENSVTTANWGLIERPAIPRPPIGNTSADAYVTTYNEGWYGNYAVIVTASRGLQATATTPIIDEAGVNQTPRAHAWARLLQGLAHGMLALDYDSAFIFDETSDPANLSLAPYNEVMTAALGYLDQAIALANANTFTIPNSWAQGAGMSNQRVAQVARSYKARFRANVARNAAERAAVDWNAVIADVNAGITTDLTIATDGSNWYHYPLYLMQFLGPWHQMNYFMLGMADQSGRYQAWLQENPAGATPFVMVTPDQRFPQGADTTTQRATPGRYIQYKGFQDHAQAGRGQWRWSLYRDVRHIAAGRLGVAGPAALITVRELALLRAEGLFRTGNQQGAADIINETRVANGGLTPTNAAGLNVECVPRLPNGSCGNLLEMLKWEKRIENFGQNVWFYDSRGWGDLFINTPIHLPVPARELQVLGKPLYTTGGGMNPGSAPKSTYAFPAEG